MNNKQLKQTPKGFSFLPYLILWISANGMTWFPGMYRLNFDIGYGDYENEGAIVVLGLVILTAILITVYSIVVYIQGKDAQNQKRILGVGFLMPAILGGIFNVILALFSERSNSHSLSPALVILGAYAVFFVIGLANAMINKRVMIFGGAVILIAIGWSFPRQYEARGWRESDERARLEGLATRSECGNGICERDCVQATIDSGVCQFEDPINCPSDCALRCTWKPNQKKSSREQAQGDYLCSLGIASVSDGQKAEKSGIAQDLVKTYGCSTAGDCPIGHTCANVDLAPDFNSRTDPTKGRVCVVNPVPDEVDIIE